MEAVFTTETLWLFGIGISLLLTIILNQRHTIRRLYKEQERHLTARHTTNLRRSSRGSNNPFAHAPYPTCGITSKEEIVWANPAFWALFSGSGKSVTLRTLRDIDNVYGSKIAGEQYKYPRQISIRTDSNNPEAKRRFSLVSWALEGLGSNQEYVLLFMEQTGTERRKVEQIRFESQLISYLSYLSNQLGKHLHTTKDRTSHTLTPLAEETATFSQYLQNVHEHIRFTRGNRALELGELCRNLIHEFRPRFHQKNVHLVTTLPHHLPTYGNVSEFSLGLHTLLEAVLEQVREHGSVRIHVDQVHRAIRFTVTVEHQTIPENEMHELFHFGNGTNLAPRKRFWQLRLAIAQQIFLKHKGWLSVSSEEDLGTVYQLTLAGPARSTR